MTDSKIDYLPIDPIPELTEWTDTLTGIAAEPLEFCPDFPTVARRFEAFWSQDVIDRPIFISAANTNPDRPINRRLELMDNPQRWFEAKLADMKQLHRVGDSLPNIRVDFGAVLLGSLFGGRREVGSDTSWTHAFINDDWSNEPDWTIDEDNADWKLLLELTDIVAQDAVGRYCVCTPDLGGSGDVLLNLRGSGELAMDTVMQPKKIIEAQNAMYPGWHQAYTELYRRTVGRGAPIINWLGLWSNRPYMIPACDFNALVGPHHFQELLLPDIARQAATAGRAVFHLDGPDAARHVDALLALPELQAIQYTPGAGTPSALAKVAMLRKIQEGGKSVVIFTPVEEVLQLADELSPEGLCIIPEGRMTPAEWDDLFAEFCKKY